MKGAMSILIMVLVAGCGGVTSRSLVARDATIYPPNTANICLLAGSPPSDLRYEVLGRIVATKRTYGSSDELFPPMALEARKLGADAIISLQANQRFKGPLPWRVTSPTGDGQAIKVLPDSPSLDCLQAGGRLWGPAGLEVTSAALQASAVEATRSSERVDAEVRIADDSVSRPNLYSELLKLDDLRQNGLLTEAEFETEKRELLESN